MPNLFTIRDINLSVPLDYSQPEGQQINLFAREITRHPNAPICVFLQGGPGFEAPKDPYSIPWLDFMLDHFRVVLMDQRGTGRSHGIGPELCESLPDPEDQLAYISQFRADNIVRDLEQLRAREFGGARWYLLGQSFGGFISCHYLSVQPEALAGVMICGGLPPMLTADAPSTYDLLVNTVYQRSQTYYRAYPEDIAKVKRIVELLEASPYPLGRDGVMTARRFLDLGMLLGTTSGFSTVHALLDNPFVAGSGESQLRYGFIEPIRQQASYETNPLYVLLHEAIYCEQTASNWAAAGAMQRHGGFDPARLLNESESPTGEAQLGVSFYGETVRPDMLEDYGQLHGFKAVADLLAAKDDWPKLYDLKQLAKNTVPVECIVYEQDYYVDRDESLKTAAAINGANVWLHPEWQHDGIRAHGSKVVEPLARRVLSRSQ